MTQRLIDAEQKYKDLLYKGEKFFNFKPGTHSSIDHLCADAKSRGSRHYESYIIYTFNEVAVLLDAIIQQPTPSNPDAITLKTLITDLEVSNYELGFKDGQGKYTSASKLIDGRDDLRDRIFAMLPPQPQPSSPVDAQKPTEPTLEQMIDAVVKSCPQIHPEFYYLLKRIAAELKQIKEVI